MRILEFFEDQSKQLSSKRLAFLTALPFVYLGTIYIALKLIKSGRPELAIQLFESFYILIAVFGGFISTEILPAIFSKFKRKNDVKIEGEEINIKNENKNKNK